FTPSTSRKNTQLVLYSDQFLCSICLDVFTDPVTTPCGHNFCINCINEHWNTSDQNRCPMCKKDFITRPDLRVNTFISEMVVQFRQSAQQKASSSRMCTKHDKPLELFCKSDQTCVCMLCTVLDHKNHEYVPLKEECEEKKVELKKTEAKIQQMIQKRRVKIQEIKHSVDISEEDAGREKAEGVQVFTDLMESVERGLKELLKTIEEKQEATKKQAEAFIRELEEEISELMKRSAEVEQLSLSEDHLHLLQSSNIHQPPPTKDWTELEETLSKKMKKWFAELKRVQMFAVDLTLDPETAHPYLILSDDGKQVRLGDWKNLPNNPERFSNWLCVLTKQSFSSGRFYFEVQVEGKTWWYLGVNRESVDRKGSSPLSPQDGYWTLWLINGNKYKASDGPPVDLSVKSGPQKVGVFVDYEQGVVSFYDVEAAALIYSFTGCSFTEKLFPFFNPGGNDGRNSAPLIISPVRV
uniref:Bloodthirsty-related gene family, member 2 n=1 Tax=Gasterosteus aculeatus TaxID=69293 RepID=G3Q7Y1_GASAC